MADLGLTIQGKNLKTKDTRETNLLIAFEGTSLARKDAVTVFIFPYIFCKTASHFAGKFRDICMKN